MARITQGILGGFRGKVGTDVGSSIFGIDVMRAYQPDVKNPQTEEQTKQRNKFTIVIDWLLPLISAIRVGFSLNAIKMSPWNAAISYNILNAIGGNYPSQEIVKGDVLIAKGNLSPLIDFSCRANDDSTLYISDASDLNSPLIDPTDKLFLAFWHHDDYWLIIPEAGTRQQLVQGGYTPINCGAYTVDHEVRAYAFYRSADGQKISNSDYNPGETIG